MKKHEDSLSSQKLQYKKFDETYVRSNSKKHFDNVEERLNSSSILYKMILDHCHIKRQNVRNIKVLESQ